MHGRGAALGTVLLLATSHLIAFLVFSTGFLSTRLELPFFSTCSGDGNSRLEDLPSYLSEGCLPAPLFNRTVILIVDALRADFFFGSGDMSKGGGKSEYAGLMPKMSALLQHAVRIAHTEHIGSVHHAQIHLIRPLLLHQSCTRRR